MSRLCWWRFPLSFRLFTYVHVSCSDWPYTSVIVCNVSVYLLVWLWLSRSSLNYIFIWGGATKVARIINLTVFIFESWLQECQSIIYLAFVERVDRWSWSLVWITHLAALIWVGVWPWIFVRAVDIKSLFVLIRMNCPRKTFVLLGNVIVLSTRSSVLVTLTKCVSKIVLWILARLFCVTKKWRTVSFTNLFLNGISVNSWLVWRAHKRSLRENALVIIKLGNGGLSRLEVYVRSDTVLISKCMWLGGALNLFGSVQRWLTNKHGWLHRRTFLIWLTWVDSLWFVCCTREEIVFLEWDSPRVAYSWIYSA